MATTSYSCFFITPIGEEGTENRNNADMAMNVLLMPALVQCGFSANNIFRADHLTGNNLSEDMKYHLDNDELCIVDVTGFNSNVMYEFGYRQGLGKSLILIRDKNDQTDMPFDISHERLIIYDFKSSNAFHNLPVTINTLRQNIQQRVDEGFIGSQGSGSVQDILSKLNSLESRLNRLLADSSGIVSDSTGEDNAVAKVVRELGSPIAAFNYALTNRDPVLAEGLLPRIKHSVSKEYYLRAAVAQAAALGSEKAAMILENEWDYIDKHFSLDEKSAMLGCYVNYCNKHNCELDKLEFVGGIIENLQKQADISSNKEATAMILNQKNRIYHGAYTTTEMHGTPNVEYLDSAIEALLEATKISPNEASFFYNLAICYREKGNTAQSVSAIESCLALEKDDADHLALAYKIYNDVGNTEKAKEAKNRLHSISPLRADML